MSRTLTARSPQDYVANPPHTDRCISHVSISARPSGGAQVRIHGKDSASKHSQSIVTSVRSEGATVIPNVAHKPPPRSEPAPGCVLSASESRCERHVSQLHSQSQSQSQSQTQWQSPLQTRKASAIASSITPSSSTQQMPKTPSPAWSCVPSTAEWPQQATATGVTEPAATQGLLEYSFGPGPLGLVLQDSTDAGGLVVVASLAEGSPASELGVPINSVLVHIGARSVAGKDNVAVGKMIAQAQRPMRVGVKPPSNYSEAPRATTPSSAGLVTNPSFPAYYTGKAAICGSAHHAAAVSAAASAVNSSPHLITSPRMQTPYDAWQQHSLRDVSHRTHGSKNCLPPSNPVDQVLQWAQGVHEQWSRGMEWLHEKIDETEIFEYEEDRVNKAGDTTTTTTTTTLGTNSLRMRFDDLYSPRSFEELAKTCNPQDSLGTRVVKKHQQAGLMLSVKYGESLVRCGTTTSRPSSARSSAPRVTSSCTIAAAAKQAVATGKTVAADKDPAATKVAAEMVVETMVAAEKAVVAKKATVPVVEEAANAATEGKAAAHQVVGEGKSAFSCSPLEHAGSAAAEAMSTSGSCVAPSCVALPVAPRTLPAQTLPLQRNQPPEERPTFLMAPSVVVLLPSAAAVPPAAIPPATAMPPAALEPSATLPPATLPPPAPPPPAPPPPAHTTGADDTPASTSAASTPLQLQLRLPIPPRTPKAVHVQSARTAYRFAPLAPAPGAPAVSARVQRPLGDDSPLDSSSRRRAGKGAYWLSELKLKSTGLKSTVEGSSPRQRSLDKHFRTQPISASTPRDESGGLLSTRQLLPYFSERSSPFKDPMPLVLCKRGEVSTRSATMNAVHC